MESIESEDERYAFYQKPNGYHLYRREETEDGVREIPVFSNYSGAVLHNREVLTDTFDVETPSQDMKRALGFIEKQAEAIREHGEDSPQYEEVAEAFNAHVQLLNQMERNVVLTAMEYVANSENFEPELEVIQNLIEWGQVDEDISVEQESEEPDTVDIEEDGEDDEDEGEVIDLD